MNILNFFANDISAARFKLFLVALVIFVIFCYIITIYDRYGVKYFRRKKNKFILDNEHANDND
jgi:hypothetical protein